MSELVVKVKAFIGFKSVIAKGESRKGLQLSRNLLLQHALHTSLRAGG